MFVFRVDSAYHQHDSILTKLCNYPDLVRHKAQEYLSAEKEEEAGERALQ